MDTQTSLQPVIIFSIAVISSVQPVLANSRDYGFDFDEEEVVREMLAPLPVDLSLQAMPEVNADEFEQVFPCFLS
jgi:hypothetical protein